MSQGNVTTGSEPFDVETRVGQYIEIRDTIAAKKKALEEELKPYNEAKRLMESMFLAFLSETKQTSAATLHGTVHLTDKNSATVEDMDLFRKFIVDNELWHLVDWRANAPQVAEYAAKNDGALPPGVKYTTFRTTGVRRS